MTPKESTTPDPDPMALSRLALDALNRRDLDAAMRIYAPGAIHESVGLGVISSGRMAIRRFYEDLISSYEEFALEPEVLLELGNGVVFGVACASGRPVDSSARVNLRFASVSVWEQGLIVQQTTNGNIDEARAAAEGLAGDRG